MTPTEVEPPMTLTLELAGTLMTPAEFDAVQDADENYVYELINGVLVVTPPPLEGERKPNDVLGQWFLNYRDQHPQGSALNETLPEHTVPTTPNRRRADRVVWAGLGRRPNPRKDIPTIAIEFVAAGKRNRRRDFIEKKKEYRKAGVEEYWIIDRFRRQMTVHRADGTEVIVSANEKYSTPLLPGFELDLKTLLVEANRYGT